MPPWLSCMAIRLSPAPHPGSPMIARTLGPLLTYGISPAKTSPPELVVKLITSRVGLVTLALLKKPATLSAAVPATPVAFARPAPAPLSPHTPAPVLGTYPLEPCACPKTPTQEALIPFTPKPVSDTDWPSTPAVDPVVEASYP